MNTAWQMVHREAAKNSRRFLIGGPHVAVAGKRSIYSMTTDTTHAEICSICKEPVKGCFEVFSYSRLGIPQVQIDSTPDRNFNVCDWCNKTVCFRCSNSPDSGLCNDCFRLSSVSIDDDKENKRALTPTTMDEGPTIIYEEPQGSEIPAQDRAKLVLKLIKHREVDIADFQGRIETLTDKLHEVVNEFGGYMGDIDAAITDVMNATNLSDATESADQFSKTN